MSDQAIVDTLREKLTETAEPAIEPANEPQSVEATPEPANEPMEATDEKPARARDESGKFTKEPKAKKNAAAKGDVSSLSPPKANGAEVPTSAQDKGAGAVPGPQTPSVVPNAASAPESVPQFKAPQSWKPAAREHFAKLPPEAQAEIDRREKEFATALQDASEAKRGYQAFREAVAPYEAMIRAEGGEPLRAVQSLFQTAAALRTAPPQHKAQLVAQMVKAYGVPIEALDAALVGETPPANQPQEFRDPRFDQFLAQMQERQRQAAQIAQEKSQRELQAFAESHEFFDDVRMDMADLMDMAEKRKQTMTMEQAYTKACMMNDEIAAVMRQREAAKAAQAGNANVQRAKLAASSVKSSPAATVGNGVSLEIEDLLRANLRGR